MISMPIITVIKFGGHWCCTQVNPDDSKSFIGQPATDQKSTIIFAKHFAEEHGFLYQADALVFNKPIVTIWRTLGCWLPAKIFDDRIEGAGVTTVNKEEAKSNAKQFAKVHNLEYFPSIGESAFRDFK